MERIVYLVHVHVSTDKPLTEEKMNELFSYLEGSLHDDTNITAEVAYYEQI